MPETSIKLPTTHKQLAKIGPHHASVADPETVKINYRAESRYQKVPRQHQFCRVWLTRSARQNFSRIAQARYEGNEFSKLFASSAGDHRARLRRATGHVYSMTAISELDSLVMYQSMYQSNQNFQYPERSRSGD